MKQRQKVRSQYESGYTRMLQKSDDSDEETELYVYNRQPHKEIPTIEKVVEEGDTLQSLSIRYCCSIAELKRINNIHKENEIFARRTIKVPHRPLTIALAGVHVSGTSSPTEDTSALKKEIDTHTLNSKLGVTLSNLPSSSNSNTNFNEVIFNSNISSKNCDNVDNGIEYDEEEEEEVQLLPQSEHVIEPPVVSRLNCSGADADISWIALIVCIIVVIFAIPLIYVFYIAEHPENYHHDHIS